jgi:cell division protein FtsB
MSTYREETGPVVDSMLDKLTMLQKENAALKAKLVALERENERLRERVAQLEKRE